MGKMARLVAALVFAGLATASLAYQGNGNFRNVPATYAASFRTDWVTNASVMASCGETQSSTGVSTPIDWSLAQSITNGIQYIPAVLTTGGGWPRTLVCHFVRIDLATPKLCFTGSGRCADWGEDMPDDPEHQAALPDGVFYKKRTVREKTGDFLARLRGPKEKGGMGRNAVLAWNNAAWKPWKPPYTNEWGAPTGPLYSDGVEVSGLALGGGIYEVAPEPQGIFVVFRNGAADIVRNLTPSLARETWFSVPAFRYRLVTSGKANECADASVRPRTAIGLSRDRKTFYILVCDGDNKREWTKGCDFQSLSALLVAMGCYDAINLDGGGSSVLCAWDCVKDRPMVLSRPGGNYNQRDNGSNAAIYFE